MNAQEALDAYIAASSNSWRTFLDYRFGHATEGQVARANRYEAEALSALRSLIGDAA